MLASNLLKVSKAVVATTAAAVVALGSTATATANTEESDPTGTIIDFHGMTIEKKVADDLDNYAAKNNLDLDKEFSEKPVTKASAPPANGFTFYASNRGGIEVPPGYDYDPGKGALHDYCTHSPDQFPAPGENADFSGACAKHDMCYEHTDRSDKDGMRTCDSNLRNDLMRVCEAVYTSPLDPRRGSCQSTALGYYGAVVAFHHDNYWG